MEQIINTTGVPTTDYINDRKGDYRVIVKTRGGMLSVGDVEMRDYLKENPTAILQSYKPKALQTVEFRPEGSKYWLTVFARTGKKIHTIDNDILRHITVGTINSYFLGTTIYNMSQYKAVGATSHASKAFTQNK